MVYKQISMIIKHQIWDMCTPEDIKRYKCMIEMEETSVRRPVKDRTGKMTRLKAQELLYLIRRENLYKRLMHLKLLMKDNDEKLIKVKKKIKEIVYGKLK